MMMSCQIKKPERNYHNCMVKSYSKTDLEMTLFDHMAGINDMEPEQMDCKIYDWDIWVQHF